jgi:hypothetical protein
MTTTINENGTLTIKAESGIEEFALTRWFQVYTEKTGECSLCIETHKHIE